MTPKKKLTGDQWNKIWDQHWAAARREQPTADLKKLHLEVYRSVEEAYGPQPKGNGPKIPWWARLGIKVVKRKVKTMQWDWVKTFWKAVRGAAMAAVVMAVLFFLGAFDTTDEVLASGVPEWAAGLIAMGVAALLAWLRNFLKIKYPGALPKVERLK